MAILGGLRQRLVNFIDPNRNLFNEAFFKMLGGGYTQYDTNADTYIEKGYNYNPLVYTPISQMSNKTASIPYYIKKIEDKKSLAKYNNLRKATSMNMTFEQKIRFNSLEKKAFEKDVMTFPLEAPNPNQSWTEFFSLYKTFIKCTGNFYQYDLSPSEGKNAGQPIASYILPSHKMQIVLKSKPDMLGIESPIDYYMLIEGNQFIKFPVEDIIHVKYANPNYDQSGSHLYGLAPLKAGLRNIQSSNTGIDLNIKTQLNGGAFGFITAKDVALQPHQAEDLKKRLKEMDASRENLSKIAGYSVPLEFTRMSLSSDELKPFDYLDFDEKQIAGVLDWPLDSGDRGDYGGTLKEIKKWRITDNIVPDLNLLTDAWNKHYIPKFKGYEGSCIEFDVMELPEMQDDLNELSTYLYNGLDRAVFNRDEVRAGLRYNKLETPEMERYTVAQDVMTLEEAISNEFDEPTIDLGKFSMNGHSKKLEHADTSTN